MTGESPEQTIHGGLTRIEKLRFASARRMSLKLARTIADASCRDAALQQIIELCIKANDMDTSRILVQGIQSDAIREELFLAHPSLLH